MQYQEKLKLAKVYFSHLEEGKTEGEINELMLSPEVTKFDLQKICRSARTLLDEKYGPKIKDYLLKETLEDNIDEFDHLSEESFNTLQLNQHQAIIINAKALVNKMLKNGKDRDEIMSSAINPYFNANDVDAQIEKYKYNHEPVDSQTQAKYFMIGGGAIILGIVLSMSTTRVFYGLVIFGLIYFFRGFQTQSEIDYDNRK